MKPTRIFLLLPAYHTASLQRARSAGNGIQTPAIRGWRA